MAGTDLRAALVASCLRGALPPVDLRVVCLVWAMVDDAVVDERWCVVVRDGAPNLTQIAPNKKSWRNECRWSSREGGGRALSSPVTDDDVIIFHKIASYLSLASGGGDDNYNTTTAITSSGVSTTPTNYYTQQQQQRHSNNNDDIHVAIPGISCIPPRCRRRITRRTAPTRLLHYIFSLDDFVSW